MRCYVSMQENRQTNIVIHRASVRNAKTVFKFPIKMFSLILRKCGFKETEGGHVMLIGPGAVLGALYSVF